MPHETVTTDRENWLRERALLQRRIHNQRVSLRRLNKAFRAEQLVKQRYMFESWWKQARAFEQAAKIAESHAGWFGRRIAARLRREA